MSKIIHPFPPIYNCESKILILGSFPSVKSRENNFYYGHPQNRFWKVLANLFNEPIPVTNKEKENLCLNNSIALWDVIKSCEITGSSDITIKNVTCNDIQFLLLHTKIKKIYVNGKTAEKYYNKYLLTQTNLYSEYLPSTSPANAKMSLGLLIEKWSIIKSTD